MPHSMLISTFISSLAIVHAGNGFGELPATDRRQISMTK
jgi:hypothetical protein